MKTKEELLAEFCEGHYPDDTYLDIERNTIDGRASDVLQAMEAYSKQQLQLFGEFLYKRSEFSKQHIDHVLTLFYNE